MYNRSDPRFRRTLNQISQNFEAANETAQVGIFSITKNYIRPCLSGFGFYLQSCTAPCLPRREERLRRRRARTRAGSRPELNFDFYDRWQDDEQEALLSWGNDEFDALLVGNDAPEAGNQPGPQKTMNYGSQGDGKSPRARQTSDGGGSSKRPAQSSFGLFGKLPFKMGGRYPYYRPSGADLRERPKDKGRVGLENEVTTKGLESTGLLAPSNHGRQRSVTTSSGHTINSYSSRGDIFLSDDDGDAVPLDDELAPVLDRRMTNHGHEDGSNAKTRDGKRPGNPRTSTQSSRTDRKSRKSGSTKSSSIPRTESSQLNMTEVSSLSALKTEERGVEADEEEHVDNQKEVGSNRALEKGLSSKDEPHYAHHRSQDQVSPVSPLSPEQTISETTPFPAFEMDPNGTAHTEANSPAPSQSGPSLMLPQVPVESDRKRLDARDQHKDRS